MTDSKQPSVTMETAPVICGRCQRELAPLMIEEIAGISQLRAGAVLIPKIEANCLHCGWTFYWSIREKDVQHMTVLYKKIIDHYIPE